MKSKTMLTCAMAVALVAGLVTWGSSTLEAKQGKTRPMTIEQLMEGTVNPHCKALKKGLEAEPTSEKAWGALATNAALLNEASYSLMDDGRCPDKVWADAATKTLRPHSDALLKALKSQDFASAKAAFGAMTKSCKACHDEHKKKK
ncbi:MAG: cytochrome c [Planctomycetota bacterium]|jgi:cytochrome c556